MSKIKKERKKIMHIAKRNGSWYYVIDVGTNPVTGKRMQKKKGGFSTEREAKRAGQKAEVEFQNGLYVDTERMSFGELCGIFLKEYQQRNNVKQSTYDLKVAQVNAWLKHFDVIEVRKITRQLIQNSLDQMSEHYSEKTMVTLFATLKMVLERGREIKCIITDPSEFAYLPKKRKSLEEVEAEAVESKYLEKPKLKHFLESAKLYGKENDYPLFLLLAYTGLRISEALALKWSDIDFENYSISISKSIYNSRRKGTDFILDTPKTKTSKRVLTVDDKVFEQLRKLRTFQKEKRFVKRNRPDFDFVFINYDSQFGYPLRLTFVSYRLNRILKIAEINQKITCHTFRHTHTSLLAEAGVDLVSIMDRLGHKDDKTTREIYLHVTAEMKKEAAHKFSKLMDSL